MAANSKLEARIEEIVKPLCIENGCSLYSVEYNSGGRVLTIFIDKIGEEGVGLKDCENVSRALSEVLDTEEDLIPASNYSLEVSSPGIERKLSQFWHFEAALSKKVELKLFESLGRIQENVGKKLERQKLLAGTLERVNENSLVLNIDGNLFEIPLEKISKAKTLFEM